MNYPVIQLTSTNYCQMCKKEVATYSNTHVINEEVYHCEEFCFECKHLIFEE